MLTLLQGKVYCAEGSEGSIKVIEIYTNVAEGDISCRRMSWGSHVQRPLVLALWSVALSADSAAQLDIRRFVKQPSQAWDTEMAAEMWWRASALEALQVPALPIPKPATVMDDMALVAITQ